MRLYRCWHTTSLSLIRIYGWLYAKLPTLPVHLLGRVSRLERYVTPSLFYVSHYWFAEDWVSGIRVSDLTLFTFPSCLISVLHACTHANSFSTLIQLIHTLAFSLTFFLLMFGNQPLYLNLWEFEDHYTYTSIPFISVDLVRMKASNYATQLSGLISWKQEIVCDLNMEEAWTNV